MRDYDPTTGRYLQADPLGLVDGASVYGYALGNPGRYVDPRGEQTWGPDVPFTPRPSPPNVAYDPRVEPTNRTDPYHNFPYMYDADILDYGPICGCGVTSDGFYVERHLPGTRTNPRTGIRVDGYYELGMNINLLTGQMTIVHRMFNPNRPKGLCLPFWPRLPGAYQE